MNSIFVGIGWVMVGATAGASFYVPIGKVKKWSWETTWAVAGIFSWVILPVVVSLLLLPDLWGFYSMLEPSVVWKTSLLGFVWGIGNVNYGLTMRYLGLSLGIGAAIGVTLVVGTLLPPILHGQVMSMLSTRSGLMTLVGVLVAMIGIAVVSYAGYLKEQQFGCVAKQFNVKRGLLLAVLCGIFSAGMPLAIDAGKPIARFALHFGVPPMYAAMPSYVPIMLGGSLANFGYCFLRLTLRKDISLKSDLSQPLSVIATNATMAVAGGTIWYLQYFFLAWGASTIPQNLSYMNWMLLMSGYILCGGLLGLILGEWTNVKARPVRLLWLGMICIICAANLVGIGMAF